MEILATLAEKTSQAGSMCCPNSEFATFRIVAVAQQYARNSRVAKIDWKSSRIATAGHGQTGRECRSNVFVADVVKLEK
jgi:hypothetical protein